MRHFDSVEYTAAAESLQPWPFRGGGVESSKHANQGAVLGRDLGGFKSGRAPSSRARAAANLALRAGNLYRTAHGERYRTL